MNRGRVAVTLRPVGTVVTILIVIFAALVLFVSVTRQASLTKARMAHKDRCAFCRSRLKKTADKFGFAATCAKCGKTQPWAA